MNERILLISLGCDKNLVDSEMMLGQLADRGYTFTDDEEEADIAVINSAASSTTPKKRASTRSCSLRNEKRRGS